jgi:hypothetical protein
MVCLAAAACTGSGGMSSSLPEGGPVCFRLRAVPTGSVPRPPSWVRVLEVSPEESVPLWHRYHREPSRVTAITAILPEAHGWVQTNQVGWSELGDRLTIVTRDPENERVVRLSLDCLYRSSCDGRIWENLLGDDGSLQWGERLGNVRATRMDCPDPS